jgi:hypothetical protein
MAGPRQKSGCGSEEKYRQTPWMERESDNSPGTERSLNSKLEPERSLNKDGV